MTATTTLKDCHGGRGHDDAGALVGYLFAHGGKIAMSNDSLAVALGFTASRGGGVFSVDRSRFVQARNHVKDRVSGGGPCTGYTLHYRSSRHGTEFVLIDPSGSLGSHLAAAIETVRGWLVAEARHHTENLRQITIFDRLGDHARAQNDKDGEKLCIRAAIEIDRDGTVSASTMGEMNVWLATLARP